VPGISIASHRATQRRLLIEEQAARRRLPRILDSIPSSRGPEGNRFTARVLRGAVADGLMAVRQDARAAGRETFALELGAALGPQRDALSLPPTSRPADADQASVAAGALFIATTWLRRATEVALADPAADASREASRATERRLAALAGAEVADAFGAARELAADELVTAPRTEDALRLLPLLFRRWDALLDACPRCIALDGTYRLLGFEFPGGAVAGRVHRNCRCIAGIVLLPLGWVGERVAA